MILSLKDSYYDKKGYNRKPIDLSQEIILNKNYNFSLTEVKPTVLNMQELGVFINIENDTLWRSTNYKDIPLTFLSHNTIGRFLVETNTN